jgi:hypothetical protein
VQLSRKEDTGPNLFKVRVIDMLMIYHDYDIDI